MTQVAHSQPTTEEIAAVIRRDVGTVTAVRLERVFANHVYRVDSDAGIVFAKLARHGWRSVDDARWEMQLLRHLGSKGIRVPETLGEVTAMPCPEGVRALSTVRVLAGVKPAMSVSTYHAIGESLVRMHEASRDFAPSVPGRLLGANHLVRRPAAKAVPRLRARGFETAAFSAIADTCAIELDRRTADLPFGVVHGDVSLDNVHLDDADGIGFFDFDLGGHGWFAYDLAHFHAWAVEDPLLAGPFWKAMQDGYEQVRRLTPDEHAAIPWFHLAYWIWDLEHILHNYTSWFGYAEAGDAVIADRLQRLSGMADALVRS